MQTPRKGEIWKARDRSDRVKIEKVLSGQVVLFDLDGTNYGRGGKPVSLTEFHKKFIPI